jgi:tetrahydromethanopterin S-methyltransferase subunit C
MSINVDLSIRVSRIPVFVGEPVAVGGFGLPQKTIAGLYGLFHQSSHTERPMLNVNSAATPIVAVIIGEVVGAIESSLGDSCVDKTLS